MCRNAHACRCRVSWSLSVQVGWLVTAVPVDWGGNRRIGMEIEGLGGNRRIGVEI